MKKCTDEFLSGNATICSRGKSLLVENLSKGFDLYDLPRSSPSYTFQTPTRKRCIKDGVFAEESTVVACGSDDRLVLSLVHVIRWFRTFSMYYLFSFLLFSESTYQRLRIPTTRNWMTRRFRTFNYVAVTTDVIDQESNIPPRSNISIASGHQSVSFRMQRRRITLVDIDLCSFLLMFPFLSPSPKYL